MTKANKADECVKVVVRCRPLNSKEKADGRQQIVHMDVRDGSVTLKNPKSGPEDPPKVFTYDQVYDANTEQIEIFNVTAKPIVESVMNGYNGTIFAYGQTGTGKSHTMEGINDPQTPHLRGITPNAFDFVFDWISEDSGKGKEYLVYITYLEIYNEEVRDLLSKDGHMKKLDLKENTDKGVYVRGLSKMVVKSVEDMNGYLKIGKTHRHVGATAMNADSSRSHSIFTIIVECKDSCGQGAGGETHIRVGKLNLVDLAGSERQSKTQATGDRLKEGIKINMSLTALGNVIEALVSNKKGQHVPYRDSKLTRLLQDSLGGNTKTVMVANIGPADWNFDESLSTLRYANRAKNIKNKPKINEDPKDAMLREVQEEIARLKQELERREGGGGGAASPVKSAQLNEERVKAIRRQMQEEIAAKMEQDSSSQAMQAAKAEAEARARLQLEAIMAEAGSTAKQKQEAQQLLEQQSEEMAKFADALKQEMQQKDVIEQKLKAMESRVLHGGENMVEKMSELKKLAKETKAELEERRKIRKEHERRMRKLEEEEQEFEQQVGTIKEQAERYTKKLKRLYANYQAKKSERDDLNEEFQAEREDILEGIREMQREIKVKDLIIASYIPKEFQEVIMKHAHWDDYEGSWLVDAMAAAGNSIRAQRDLAAAEEQHLQQLHGQRDPTDMSLDTSGSALANVYFTYKELEEMQARERGTQQRPASRSGRPSSSRSRQR